MARRCASASFSRRFDSLLAISILASFCGTDARFPHGFGFADLAQLLLFGHAHLGFVDGLGCSFLSQCFDVSALVLDVGHVHVDEAQANLFQFHLDIGADGLEELVAVRVQFFNAHRGDDQTQLTEEDVARQFLYLLSRLAEQSFGSSQHAVGLGADTHGEAARHVHAYVLSREGVGQVGINADGCQTHVGIVFNDGPYEGTSAMYALCARLGPLVAVDDQNFVARAAAVAID